MPLTEKQRRFLRGRAHALKPIILVGQKALTDNLRAETRRALADHELIKVRVQASDRDARDALIAELAGDTDSTVIARIGHIAVLFKPSATLSRIPLPADAD